MTGLRLNQTVEKAMLKVIQEIANIKKWYTVQVLFMSICYKVSNN
jgi:hypothetical protein